MRRGSVLGKTIEGAAMLSNVFDICTDVVHLRVSHAQEHSVRIHQPQYSFLKRMIIVLQTVKSEEKNVTIKRCIAYGSQLFVNRAS